MINNIAPDIKKKAFFIGMIVALGGIILGQFGFSIGMLLGTLMSILNFIMLEKKVKIIADSGRNNPARLFLNYIFRYLLMATALWICINRGLSYFFGAALGLFTIRLGIYYGKSK